MGQERQSRGELGLKERPIGLLEVERGRTKRRSRSREREERKDWKVVRTKGVKSLPSASTCEVGGR